VIASELRSWVQLPPVRFGRFITLYRQANLRKLAMAVRPITPQT